MGHLRHAANTAVRRLASKLDQRAWWPLTYTEMKHTRTHAHRASADDGGVEAIRGILISWPGRLIMSHALQFLNEHKQSNSPASPHFEAPLSERAWLINGMARQVSGRMGRSGTW